MLGLPTVSPVPEANNNPEWYQIQYSMFNLKHQLPPFMKWGMLESNLLIFFDNRSETDTGCPFILVHQNATF